MASAVRTCVGMLHFEVLTPGVASLKEQRSVLRPLSERVRARYPVSLARVDDGTSRERACFAVAVTSADADTCRSVLQRVLRAVQGEGARIEAVRIEVERWD